MRCDAMVVVVILVLVMAGGLMFKTGLTTTGRTKVNQQPDTR